VNDGEDADVIVHEYTHAVLYDQVPGFGSGVEARALGEGIADFAAIALHPAGSPGLEPLFASWDATSYSSARPPYLRRADLSLVYPRDLTGEPHHDGQIWSRALWDFRARVGTPEALRVVFASHFLLNPGPRFRDAAEALLLANQVLREGRDEASLRAILADRKIPFDVAPAPLPPEDDYEPNDGPGEARALPPGETDDLLLADEDWYRLTVPALRRVRVFAFSDPAAGHLSLDFRTPEGLLVASAHDLAGRTLVEAAAGEDAREILLRVHRPEGESPLPYDLVVHDLPLEMLPPGRTRLLQLSEGTLLVFEIPRPALSKKGADDAGLSVRARRAGRQGARPEIRLTTAEGVRRHDFGDDPRRNRSASVLPPPHDGPYRLEIRPAPGETGRIRLRVRTR
jgi:hypothetical protein